MYMNMTAEQMDSMLQANLNLGAAIVDALKRYFTENADMICAGLAAMSGQYYRPSMR